jgi:hypothetical protein
MNNLNKFDDFVKKQYTIQESLMDMFKKDSKIAYEWLVKNNGLGKAMNYILKNKNSDLVKVFVKKYFKSKKATDNWKNLDNMDIKLVDYVVNQLRAKIQGTLSTTPGAGTQNIEGQEQSKMTLEQAEEKLKQDFKDTLQGII